MIRELRCLQCRSETIADSNVTLAADLRRQVREMMAAGKSDAEIFQHMVDRYGDYVLYKPPLAARTWLLWAAPMLLLLGGGAVAAVRDRAQVAAAGYRSRRSRPGCLVTGFIIACAAMVAAALLWIVLPLLRSKSAGRRCASRKERHVSAVAVALLVPALAGALYATLSKWNWKRERQTSDGARAADGRSARASSRRSSPQNPERRERLAAARPIRTARWAASRSRSMRIRMPMTARAARTSRRLSVSAKRWR